MLTAQQTLDQYFLEMRWRCLSLAADLDRVARADGGPEALKSDLRLQNLQQALTILTSDQPAPTRAEQVLMLFSDKTPPPQ